MALRIFKILKNTGLSYLRVRTIMTSNFDLKKVEEELQKNPYFDKYQEKIQKLRKDKPVEYHSRMKAKEDKKKGKEEKTKLVKYPEPKSDIKTEGMKKSLNDILKMDMVVDKTAEDIKNIWIDYHRGKDVIFSTYTCEQFEKLNNNYTKFPTFVIPLPRGDGYEFFLFQYSDNILHFTPLAQFKKHSDHAPECLSVAYFPELQDKGIILMRGEYDKEIVTSLESQFLLNITHMFYNGDSYKRTEMVEIFNKKADEFKFPEIISEVERMGLNVAG